MTRMTSDSLEARLTQTDLSRNPISAKSASVGQGFSLASQA